MSLESLEKRTYELCFVGWGPLVKVFLRAYASRFQGVLVISNCAKSRNFSDYRDERVSFITRSDFFENYKSFDFGKIIFAANTSKWSDSHDFSRLLEIIQTSNVQEAILFSSASIYGETAGAANEREAVSPISNYGQHKLQEEQLFLCATHGHQGSTILRISNVYGHPHFRDFPNLVISSMLKRKNVDVFGNGLFIRDYLHIDDFSRVLFSLLNLNFNQRGSVLNVSSGQGVTGLNVIEKIEKSLDRKCLVNFSKKPQGFPEQNLLDNSRLTDLTAFEFTSFDIGISEFATSCLYSHKF